MKQEEKEKLYKMIEQNCNVEELKEIKQYINHLLSEKVKFDNPEIDQHLDLLIMPLAELIDDDYLINGVSKIISRKKKRAIPYVFDLIELKYKEVATIRGIGLTGYSKIEELLEKNNISLEFLISKQDEEKLLKTIKEKKGTCK